MRLIIKHQKDPFVSGDGRKEILNYVNQDVQLTILPSGKPVLSSGYVSVSHCKNVLVILLSETPVGIDVELNKEISEKVIERLQLQPPALESWVLKEACIKLYDDPMRLFSKESEAYTHILPMDFGLIGIASTHPITIKEIVYE